MPGHLGLALGEDLVVVLDDVVRRQAAVLLGQRHRPAGGVEPDTELRGRSDLRRQEISAASRVEVQMVRGGGASRERELRQPDPGRQVRALLVERPPVGVEGLQPAEQRSVRHGRVRTGEVLIEVVVGVDQPWCDQPALGVERAGGSGPFVARPADPAHLPVGHRDPTVADLAPCRVHRHHELGPGDEQICGHSENASIMA